MRRYVPPNMLHSLERGRPSSIHGPLAGVSSRIRQPPQLLQAPQSSWQNAPASTSEQRVSSMAATRPSRIETQVWSRAEVENAEVRVLIMAKLSRAGWPCCGAAGECSGLRSESDSCGSGAPLHPATAMRMPSATRLCPTMASTPFHRLSTRTLWWTPSGRRRRGRWSFLPENGAYEPRLARRRDQNRPYTPTCLGPT